MSALRTWLRQETALAHYRRVARAERWFDAFGYEGMSPVVPGLVLRAIPRIWDRDPDHPDLYFHRRRQSERWTRWVTFRPAEWGGWLPEARP